MITIKINTDAAKTKLGIINFKSRSIYDFDAYSIFATFGF